MCKQSGHFTCGPFFRQSGQQANNGLGIDLAAVRLTLHQHFNDAGSQAEIRFDLKQLTWDRTKLAQHIVEAVIREHTMCKLDGLFRIAQTRPKVDAPRI